ncbi:MAG: hypothetical protein JRF50_11560 [Deltaproteobacteria bacterium]|nr:hypothetical protein [Deltaproteobacteria bacterium]
MNKDFCVCITSLVVIAICLFAGGALWAADAPALDKEYTLRLATSPPPSMFYGVGVTTADIMTKYTPPQITVTCSGLPGGTPAHFGRMKRNEAEISLVNSSHMFLAYHGKGRFKDDRHPELRCIAFCFPQAYHWVVRKDTGITKISQLDGKKFGPGGSASPRQIRL